MAIFRSHFLPWSHVLPDHPPSPVSLSLRAEEELGLGALRVVQQEEAEEVLVRSVQLHFALFPADGGEGSVVKHQEAAAPARHKALQPDPTVVPLRLPSCLWAQSPVFSI